MGLTIKHHWQRMVLVSIALICLAGLLGLYLVRRTPEYWSQTRRFIETTPDDELKALATDAERRFLAVTRVQSPQPPMPQPDGNKRQTITLSIEEANAWLDQKLPQWAEHRGLELSSHLQEPMVAVRDGMLVLAFRYETPEVSQIVSLWFELTIEDGMGRIDLKQIRGGNLPMPRDALLSRLEIPADDPSLHPLLAAALSGEPFEPVFQIDQQREARVVGLRMNRRQVQLVIEKQAREP